ncbi:carboxymuconolactone decarboxylase family protein [Soonwooa sp.]|uniref:carboxymuconolactone decarboxylase family protein n=1 Tax=Soonwooa sp. TaxID=1938592 RepID=UPI002624A79C|nr:carboxymuconolactone decarboxylase family protein [Soonwooa sp.]
MSQRLNMAKSAPEAYKAMIALDATMGASSLSNIQKELIKIRASQINACAFCIDMHTKDALKYGETPQRIFLLNAWWETTLYTDEEKVLLKMTEEITKISENGLTEETYQNALKLFTEQQIGEIIMAITIINAWNRIGISTHLQLPK